MLLSFVFTIEKDVIKIHYHKDIKILYQNLVDVIVKYGRYIAQSKRHHLVFGKAITGPEDCFPFIFFSDFHLIISINQV